MVTINSFKSGTGSISVEVTTHPRKFSFQNHIHNVTLAGEEIVKRYSELLLRAIRYRYSSRANKGGRNIKRQFKVIPASRGSRYSYIGGISLDPQAARWFGHIEAGRAPKKAIPLDYFKQHQENPGQKGKRINTSFTGERLKFVHVKPNLRLKNLVSKTIDKKARDFERTLVRIQEQAAKKSS